MEELKVTSPEEYAVKAQQASAGDTAGFLHQLKKTGAVVRLRRVNMEKRALVGSLPMSLVQAATAKETPEDQTKTVIERAAELTPEEIEQGQNNLIFLRQMVGVNCLEPSIRYFEGVGVYFINANNQQVAKVDEDDFEEMLAVICGEDGADGLAHFRNRKERRASAAKSRGKTLRAKAVESTEGQPASA
jgi:hypothetical protein